MGRVTPKSRTVLWPLQLLLVASLLGPALFFAYTAWDDYQRIVQHSDERIVRALDVVQEHSLKAFQTIERTIAETNEVMRGLSPEQILADEARLQRRLRRTQDTLPQIEAIWVFDKAGHPLVSSTILPVPRDLDNSDRDYFKVQVNQDAGTYIGRPITAKIGNIKFFVVSQRRPSSDESFDGIVAVSVRPEHFRDYYTRISRGLADSLSLIRDDGVFLARYPSNGNEAPQLTSGNSLLPAIQSNQEAGFITAVSQIDGIERRVGYRRVPGYPIYVTTGIETASMWRELWSRMSELLVFGLPATLGMFAISLLALRRTRSFHAEVERREVAEAALKQAQRLEAVGHLTGGVAHDFNNLLMVVKGNVDRLRRYAMEERQKRSLDAIETAAGRGASLVRQLLSFSRQQTHEPEVVNLSRYLHELQDMLRSSLRGDIAVEMRLKDEVWNTKVDLNELELAILNIAVNARDAMPQGGRLLIEARNMTLRDPAVIGLKGDFVVLSLADTGCGIPKDVLPRVFEPFYTTKDVGKGTGLGLSQVYGFAQQSGGTATASAEPGQGTVITLYLPRTQEAAADESVRMPEPLRRSGQGHVLLVEDNVDIAEVTRSILEEMGLQVTHVADARAALAALQPGAGFDLVFSDIVMPGDLNGVDLARIIRREHPSLPVLLATGYSSVAQAAMDEGYTILRKPYDAAELSTCLDRILAVVPLKASA
ncbi:response regulator [Microvirga sp. BT689]|uniref:hybrid sensor histidine kinase/response regulator n=1 Tax=Microvirga arvi TaxID=2778731 RepID=UPI00194EABC6|nr:hybrid sensor histidine kinase/response regulator [Microvirga arvi]MBM6581644.1 response regulator [Microvirga arvi]